MGETVRIAAEQKSQVATVINGTEYRARNGYFEMPAHHARAHKTFGNLPTPSALLPVGRSKGYRCQTCGFGSFFVTCSQCHGVCEREE